MSSITSGIGLVSGLPIQQLVDSLIQLQSRPILQLQDRLGLLVARRTAFLQLSAELLSIKNKSARFDDSSFFQSARAVSSNESVLLASADSGADPGQTTLTVEDFL